MTTSSYPPAGEPCQVMPLGDSITQGTDGSTHGGGYRLTLFHLAHAAGKSILLVGSRSAGPSTVDGVAWPRNHEGYPGYTVPALLRDNLTPNNIKTYKPHIVLLMIGTNDIAVRTAMPEVRLAGLVDTILNADPNLLLFLTQITPGQTYIMPASYNPMVSSYNAAMVSIVNEGRGRETHPAGGHAHAVRVDPQLRSGTDAQWHPSERCRVQTDGGDLVRPAPAPVTLRQVGSRVRAVHAFVRPTHHGFSGECGAKRLLVRCKPRWVAA